MPLSEQTLRSMAAPKMERDRDATHGNYTSYEIKELMIEWALRRSLSSFMVADTIDIDLSDVALLDIGALDSADAGEPWYSGPDMHTSLEHDMRTMQREAWLTSFLKSVGDEQILGQVRKMVEDELKTRFLLESVGDKASLLQSCKVIAQHRIKGTLLPRNTTPGPLKDNVGYSIEVCLTTLRGGHASILDRQSLFFKCSTTLTDFLITLQDATQLSVIPPLNLRGRRNSFSQHSSATSSGHTSDRDSQNSAFTPGSFALAPALSVRTVTTRTSKTSGHAQTQSPPWPFKSRGYTLYHGPWLYRIICNKRQASNEAAGELKDEHSYCEMLKVFKKEAAHFSAEPNRESENEDDRYENRIQLMIMHSMDRKALKTERELKRAEDEAEEQFRQDMRDQGVEEDDIGDPFCRFMTRDIEYKRASEECDRKVEVASDKLWRSLRESAKTNPILTEEKMSTHHRNFMAGVREDAKRDLAAWAARRDC